MFLKLGFLMKRYFIICCPLGNKKPPHPKGPDSNAGEIEPPNFGKF
jgi:hypothetical protein